jgi:PKD repeat protein
MTITSKRAILLLLLIALVVAPVMGEVYTLEPSFDGRPYNSTTANNVYSVIHDSPFGTNSTSAVPSAYLITGTASNTIRQINRGAETWDTRFVLPNDTINSATVSLYGHAKTVSVIGNYNLVMVSFSPSYDPNVYLTTDYSYTRWGTTPLAANISYASWTRGTLNNFTAYSPDTLVTKGGYTVTGFRVARDVDNAIYAWSDSDTHQFQWNGRSNATAAYRPKLTLDITHYTSVGAIPQSITNLDNQTATSTQINWTWTNGDPTITTIQILKDNIYLKNVSYPTNYDLWTGLSYNTSYTISTRTFNGTAYLNTTWVNRTTSTLTDSSIDTIPGYTYTQSTTYAGLNLASPPTGITVEDLGPSFNASLHLYGWKIGACDGSKPIIYYDAGFHGNEYQSVYALTKWMYYLNDPSGLSPSTQANITALKAKYDFYAIPNTNPSGYGGTENATCGGTDAGRYNTHCVDINRNFPTGWYEYTGTEKGAYPVSEPETQIVYNKILQLKPVATADGHWGYYTIITGMTYQPKIVALSKILSRNLGTSFVYVDNETFPNSSVAPKETRWASYLTSSNGNLTVATTVESGNTSQTKTQETGMAMTWMYLLPYYYDAGYFGTAIPPVASFTAAPASGTSPLSVNINDTSTGPPTVWRYARNNLTVTAWELIASTRNATVSFPAGNWSVNLTASNAYGSNISTQISWVNVTNPVPPIVNFTHTIPGFTSIYEHYPVYLNDTSFSGITTWNWTVGNATTNGVNVASYTVKDPVWICPEPGMYSVYLNVTNVSGFNATTRLNYLSCLARVDGNVEIRSDPATQTIANGSTYLLTSSLNKLEINASKLELKLAWNPLIISVSNIRGNTSYYSGTQISYVPEGGEAFEYSPSTGYAYFKINLTTGGFIDASDTYRPFVDYDVKYVNYSQPGITTNVEHTYFEYYDSSTGNAWNTRKFFNTTYSLSPWIITAAFSGTPLTVPVGDAVTFTDASTGYPNRWNWTWGDGSFTNMTTQNPTHSYATPGLKTVTLRSFLWQNFSVYDDETKVNYINVVDITPPKGITGLSATTINCQNITWQWTNPTDADYSYVYVLKNNGWVGNYSTPQAAATWLSLMELTDYTFSSKTVDTSGNMNATWVNVTAQTGACGAAPVASFTYIPTSGVEPLSVQFTDTSTNAPTSWGWFFQDKTGNDTIVQFSTSQSPLKIFNQGNFTIKLNATNAYGSNVSTQISWVNVSAYVPPLVPPVAAFSANSTSICQNATVGFTDLSTNTPLSWYWEFGEGNTSILQNPTREYFSLGTYTVNLRATNADGFDWENKTNYITVNDCTPIPPVLQCVDAAGNIPVLLSGSTYNSLNWTWVASDVTKVSLDGVYLNADIDNSSPFLRTSGFSGDTWHMFKIYNSTDYGRLNCKTNTSALGGQVDVYPVSQTPISPYLAAIGLIITSIVRLYMKRKEGL